MTYEYPPEPTPEGPLMVPFGPGADDVMPLSWASKMLAQLAKDNSRLFGKLLQSAALNEQP